MPSRRLLPVAGFTLVEVMLVVAITGILVAAALPSFGQVIENQRAKSAATDIVIALTRARSEAVKRGTNVTLSPKTSDWAGGWQIPDPASGTLLEDHEALRPGLTVTLAPSTLAGIVFRSSGRVLASSNPSFSIGGRYPDSARCVYLDLSGRPTIKSGAC